jgi:bifunctional non-homologous end joining protein LigD
LVLVRCPQGLTKQCFYQKHPGESLSSDIPRTRIREKSGAADYLYIEQASHLIALVQAGTLEVHAWGSRVDDLERPDTLVFDLDPGEDVAWRVVLGTARDLRQRLDDLGLESFVRTTGGKGLHVVVPLKPSQDWDAVKAFAHAVAEAHAADDAQRLTTNMAKARRRGRVFLDYLRNGRGATAIASYATRARPGAPVAVPLRWNELSPRIAGNHYNLDNVRRRLGALGSDPWSGFRKGARPLTRRMLDAVGVSGKSSR